MNQRSRRGQQRPDLSIRQNRGKVVAATGSDTVAFKNPGGRLQLWRGKDVDRRVGGKNLQCAMPGNGWATVNYTP